MSSGLDETQRAARDQFDKQSAKYGAGHILQNIDDLRRGLSYVNVTPGTPALDIATGGGHTGLFLAGQGFRVTFADLSFSMLSKVKGYAAERNIPANLCCHPAEKLPYADGSFELVSCRIAPHHFTCPASFIMECSRVLKKGGRMILIDGTVEDDRPTAEEWLHQVEKLRDPSHGRFVTPNKWTWLYHEAGMRVLHRELLPMKQPDLEWYFETAATPPQNREKVLRLIESAPDEAKSLFKLGNENGKIVWWWQTLLMVTEKPL